MELWLLKTKIVTENELESVPKGTMIIKICKNSSAVVYKNIKR